MSHLTTIINQTWTIVDEIDSSIQRENRSINEQKSVENKQKTSQTSELLKIEKDIVLAKDGTPTTPTLSQPAPNLGKAQLPTPQGAWNAFQNLSDSQPMGLIAIMSEVLTMQIRSNQGFYKTLFVQSTQEMLTTVKFVPMTAEAIRNAYLCQSETTHSQAEMNKAEGKVVFMSFVSAIIFAGGADFFDSDNPLNKNTDKITYEPENPDDMEMDNLTEDKELSKNVTEDAKEDKSVMGNLKQGKNWASSKGMTVFKKLINGLGKGLQASSGAAQGADAGAKWLVLPGYQNKQALLQASEGKFQALSKETEGYGSFYNQGSNQNWQLLQGVEQNIGSINSILTQAANTLGSASQRIFQ